jgi:hypothetical protein
LQRSSRGCPTGWILGKNSRLGTINVLGGESPGGGFHTRVVFGSRRNRRWTAWLNSGRRKRKIRTDASGVEPSGAFPPIRCGFDSSSNFSRFREKRRLQRTIYPYPTPDAWHQRRIRCAHHCAHHLRVTARFPETFCDSWRPSKEGRNAQSPSKSDLNVTFPEFPRSHLSG